MYVDSDKLYAELLAAGIPVAECSPFGVIEFKAEATRSQINQASVILSAHLLAVPIKDLRMSQKSLACLTVRLSSLYNTLNNASKNKLNSIIDTEAVVCLAYLQAGGLV